MAYILNPFLSNLFKNAIKTRFPDYNWSPDKQGLKALLKLCDQETRTKVVLKNIS